MRQTVVLKSYSAAVNIFVSFLCRKAATQRKKKTAWWLWLGVHLKYVWEKGRVVLNWNSVLHRLESFTKARQNTHKKDVKMRTEGEDGQFVHKSSVQCSFCQSVNQSSKPPHLVNTITFVGALTAARASKPRMMPRFTSFVYVIYVLKPDIYCSLCLR